MGTSAYKLMEMVRSYQDVGFEMRGCLKERTLRDLRSHYEICDRT